MAGVLIINTAMQNKFIINILKKSIEVTMKFVMKTQERCQLMLP